MLYAGIDLGTSSVKLLLVNKNGDVLNSVTKEYPISFPKKGYSEQNPEDWYAKTVEGLKELVAGRERELKGIAFGGQMHGLVMLDENDNVLRPAILWNDSRSAKQCNYLNNTVGKEKLTEMTANIAFPGFTAPKILWVKENEPEIFRRCRKIMLPKDYLCYKLCGEFCTEPSDASGTLLYDVKNGCWNREMLKICSVSEEMLPEIRKSTDAVGTLKKETAAFLGLGETVVALGGGDNAAAAVGMGVVGKNKCSISLGTSGTVFITSDKFTVDGKNALHSFAHADGGYHLMGCILSAASCNKWFAEDILKTSDYAALQKNIKIGEKNSVVFLPYLMGERSPHNDPDARGAFVGMSMNTSREDMVKAVMEGVAFALRDCVEIARESGINLTTAKICGGGAKSRIWCQITADVLKMDLEIPACGEGPAYGAALMAMVAAKEYGSIGEAVRVVKTREVVRFSPDAAKLYDEGYAKFRELYACLGQWYKTNT